MKMYVVNFKTPDKTFHLELEILPIVGDIFDIEDKSYEVTSRRFGVKDSKLTFILCEVSVK